jgi:hypothetical protein
MKTGRRFPLDGRLARRTRRIDKAGFVAAAV